MDTGKTRNLADKRACRYESLNTAINNQIRVASIDIVERLTVEVSNGGTGVFFCPPCAGVDTELIAVRSGFWTPPTSEPHFRRASERHDSPGMCLDVSACAFAQKDDNDQDVLFIGVGIQMIFIGLPVWELNGTWLSLFMSPAPDARKYRDVTRNPAWPMINFAWRGCLEAVSHWLFGDVTVVDGSSSVVEPKGGLREDERYTTPNLEDLADKETCHGAIMGMAEARWRHLWRRADEAKWDADTYQKAHLS